MPSGMGTKKKGASKLAAANEAKRRTTPQVPAHVLTPLQAFGESHFYQELDVLDALFKHCQTIDVTTAVGRREYNNQSIAKRNGLDLLTKLAKATAIILGDSKLREEQEQVQQKLLDGVRERLAGKFGNSATQ